MLVHNSFFTLDHSPTQSKKKNIFQIFVFQKKSEQTDFHPLPPAVFPQIRGAVPVVKALEVRLVQTENYQHTQACKMCIGRLGEKHSPRSIDIFPCGFLVETISFYSQLLQEFTFKPNLQCIRGYFPAPRQRISAWEFQ